MPATAGKLVAVMRDVTAGPSEYLLGTPGGSVMRFELSTGFSPPRLAGGLVFYSARHGQTSTIYQGTFGGCAYRVGEGTLGDVEPHGKALTALVNQKWIMLDRSGRVLTALTGAAGSWTLDGHLVEATVSGIDVFDLQGHKRSLKKVGASPLGPLGTSQEIVSTASGVQLMDITDGALTPLNTAKQQVLRAPAGSPDGKWMAYLDQTGTGQVLELATSRSLPLPSPALATGFAWSHDSEWVAMQSVYGGASLHIADGQVVETGSLVVVSW